MTIREAIPSDAASMAELVTLLGYATECDAVRERLIRLKQSDHHLVVVAEADGMIVAWMQAHASEVLESGFRVEIVGLIVSANYRRRGVGSVLVARAEEWANRIGAEAIVVRSNTKRAVSHSFYPALGFALSKTQAVYRKHLKKEPNQAPDPTPVAQL